MGKVARARLMAGLTKVLGDFLGQYGVGVTTTTDPIPSTRVGSSSSLTPLSQTVSY